MDISISTNRRPTAVLHLRRIPAAIQAVRSVPNGWQGTCKCSKRPARLGVSSGSRPVGEMEDPGAWRFPLAFHRTRPDPEAGSPGGREAPAAVSPERKTPFQQPEATGKGGPPPERKPMVFLRASSSLVCNNHNRDLQRTGFRETVPTMVFLGTSCHARRVGPHGRHRGVIRALEPASAGMRSGEREREKLRLLLPTGARENPVRGACGVPAPGPPGPDHREHGRGEHLAHERMVRPASGLRRAGVQRVRPRRASGLDRLHGFRGGGRLALARRRTWPAGGRVLV